MERILIVRLGAMGDVIHALPAVGLLRAAFPEAHIGWAIEERWQPLLCAEGYPPRAMRGPEKPLVDAVHPLNLKRWRKSVFDTNTRQQAKTAYRELRAADYTHAVDFQGLLKSAAVARLSGARERYGFAAPKEGASTLFNLHLVKTTKAHVVEQNLELAHAVMASTASTGEVTPPPAALPTDEAAERWAEHELRSRGLTQFAIINPGAGWGTKQWPAERYAAVSRALAADGLQSLVNCGPGEEKLAQQIEEASGGAARGIFCSIAQLIALTRRASLFIGGDTGPMHLAAALQVPVVALFGPTDPARNGPYGTRSRVLRSELSHTSYAHVAGQDPGLMAITPEDVVTAARQLLQSK